MIKQNFFAFVLKKLKYSVLDSQRGQSCPLRRPKVSEESFATLKRGHSWLSSLFEIYNIMENSI